MPPLLPADKADMLLLIGHAIDDIRRWGGVSAAAAARWRYVATLPAMSVTPHGYEGM